MLYVILKGHCCDIILNVHVPTESQKGGTKFDLVRLRHKYLDNTKMLWKKEIVSVHTGFIWLMTAFGVGLL